MAEEWLEKAFNRQPDAEISAHYGEVLWRLSRKEDAIQIWKMGFNKEPNNAILLETVDRLKVHIDKLKGNIRINVLSRSSLLATFWMCLNRKKSQIILQLKMVGFFSSFRRGKESS